MTSRFAGAMSAVITVTLLAAPALVHAASVRVHTEGGGPGDDYATSRIYFQAATGERNRVRVVFAGRRATIVDPAGISPGRGCRRLDSGGRSSVRCLSPEFFELVGVQLQLGDRADFARVSGHGGSETATAEGEFVGGAGADVLMGGPDGNRFTGGPGSDRMVGGAGSDSFLEGPARSGSDTMLGGPGNRFSSDSVRYTDRRGTVRADLDGRRDDGQPGERDMLVGIEDILGGSGPDRLTGNAKDNGLYGGNGADLLTGRAGNDTLDGEGDFPARAGSDRLSGGTGHDQLRGGPGPDVLIGGPGVDTLNGSEGDDRVPARDGYRDQVTSAEGCDRVTLDGDDWYLTVPFPIDSPPIYAAQECPPPERDGPAGLTFDPLGRPGVIGYGRVDVENGLAAIVLGCPGDAPPECTATVTVLAEGRVIGESQVTLPRNGVLMWHYVTLERSFLAGHHVGDRIKGSVAIGIQDPTGRPVKRRSAVTLRLIRR